MSKFKVGDVVEFLEDYYSYTVGERATVMCVDTDSTVKVANLDFKNKPCWVLTKRLKLVVHKDPILTPEEVFKHLRKGTELEYEHEYKDNGYTVTEWKGCANPQFANILNRKWRVKPEPEVIELNGKRYKLIED